MLILTLLISYDGVVLPSPYTASFQALTVNSFWWRIRDERPDHVTRNALKTEREGKELGKELSSNLIYFPFNTHVPASLHAIYTFCCVSKAELKSRPSAAPSRIQALRKLGQGQMKTRGKSKFRDWMKTFCSLFGFWTLIRLPKNSIFNNDAIRRFSVKRKKGVIAAQHSSVWSLLSNSFLSWVRLFNLPPVTHYAWVSRLWTEKHRSHECWPILIRLTRKCEQHLKRKNTPVDANIFLFCVLELNSAKMFCGAGMCSVIGNCHKKFAHIR